MQEGKNGLKMLDLKYSKFSYENKNKENAKIELVIKYNVNCFINKENNNFVEVVFDTNINDANGLFTLFLQTVARFEIDSSNLTAEEKDVVLKRNTIAIVFPFIRSQISLLTTQPGITPILLQPIDINLLKVNQN